MPIHFTKMHALGNDFMVIDCVNQQLQISRENVVAWAQRDTGVGFDQCLIVEPSRHAGLDFFYRIFNSNGQEVGQCGNGARCLARFIQARGLSDKKNISVATRTTKLTLYLHDDGGVSVDMGIPSFVNEKNYRIQLAKCIKVYPVNIGNPHAVILVDDLSVANVHDDGQHISVHKLFPDQTNVEFMQIMSSNTIKLRVYERGCGETPACGSGAVAAVVIGQKYYDLEDRVTVQLPGGELLVQKKNAGNMFLTGAATFVYDGIIS